jgi:antitoxin (DNA-binding transcriptional repressor) of toxin-antitoxin stability system
VGVAVGVAVKAGARVGVAVFTAAVAALVAGAALPVAWQPLNKSRQKQVRSQRGERRIGSSFLQRGQELFFSDV